MFAEPLLVFSDLDMSVFQIYSSSDKSETYNTQHWLSFEKKSSSELINKTLHVIGHPHATIKRWSIGKGVKSQGKWFTGSNFTLGGNSGSPFLNDEGKVVGILHRGPADLGRTIANKGVMNYSIGTNSQELIDALNKSGKFKVTEEGHVTQTGLGLISHIEILKDELKDTRIAEKEYFNKLKRKCKDALEYISEKSENITLENPDTVEMAYAYCNELTTSQRCADEELCLSQDSSIDWESQLDKLASSYYYFYRRGGYDLGINYYVNTQDDPDQNTAFNKLLNFLNSHQQELDLELASTYIKYSNVPTLDGTNIYDYLFHYKKAPGYHLDYISIINGMLDLYFKGYLLNYYPENTPNYEALVSEFKKMMADDSMQLFHKLMLEELTYDLETQISSIHNSTDAQRSFEKKIKRIKDL